jgi:hypothetical protein
MTIDDFPIENILLHYKYLTLRDNLQSEHVILMQTKITFLYFVFFFHQRLKNFYQLQNNFSSDSKMFNPLLIVILSHEKIEIPCNTQSFHQSPLLVNNSKINKHLK